MRPTRNLVSRKSTKLLVSAFVVLMVVAVVSSSYGAAVRADSGPTLVSITYSGSLDISTKLNAEASYGGSQDISFTEMRDSNFTASFTNLTVVGMAINGSEILGGVGNATFSSSDSWSLTPHPSGNLQVSLDPPSGTPSWSSTGFVFGAVNGSQAFFIFVPSSLPQLINSTMTITDTQAPSLPPQIVSLFVLPPAVDGYGAALYATIGGQGSDLPQDAMSILAYILAHGQLATSDPTHSQDIPFGGEMPSQASFGGEAALDYTGDLSLTVLNVQSSTPQSTSSYTLNLKPGDGGTTNPPPENYTQTAGTFLDVTALPDGNSSLSYWLLDGNNVGSANPYSASFDGNHVLQPIFGSGTDGQAMRNVGVHPSNWAEYTVSVNTGGSGLSQDFTNLMDVTSVRGTIESVMGSVLTIDVVAKFTNGSELSLGRFTTDADSGFTSNNGFGAFIIGSGLSPNEQIFTSSHYSLPNGVLNDTSIWTQNGFSQRAVHLKSDSLGEYFWDQGTGLLLYARVPIYGGDSATPVGYVIYTLTSTNLFRGEPGSTMGSPWSFLTSPGSMTFWIELIVVALLIVVVIVAILRSLSRRRKRVSVPPAGLSKKAAGHEEGGMVAPPRVATEPVMGVAPSKFTFCPDCGRTLPSHVSKFCPFCGFSLSEQGESKAGG